MNLGELMDISWRDHAIFRDFKEVKIHVDLTISYPSGAGGHWLAGQLANYHRSSTDINRYDSQCIWLDLDDDLLVFRNGSPYLDIDLDRLYRQLSSSLNQQQFNIACGHLPPMLTHLITDYRTKELAVIECRTDTAWFVQALGRCKALLDPSYHEKQWLRRVLPADQDPNDPSSAYVTMMDRMQDRFTRVNLWMTPLTWMWWDHALCHDEDRHDMDRFADYAASQLFNSAISENQNQLHGTLLMQQAPWYQTAMRHMASVTNCITVDYGEYYLDSKESGSCYLDGINRAQRGAYSMANIDLIMRCTSLVGLQLQYDIQRRCSILRTRLTART